MVAHWTNPTSVIVVTSLQVGGEVIVGERFGRTVDPAGDLTMDL